MFFLGVKYIYHVLIARVRRSINLWLRDHTLSMKKSAGRGGEGRWRRAFVGAMKYCRLTLMGHEIFFKIFDGPRNIVACSIFIILFFKLKG